MIELGWEGREGSGIKFRIAMINKEYYILKGYNLLEILDGLKQPWMRVDRDIIVNTAHVINVTYWGKTTDPVYPEKLTP